MPESPTTTPPLGPPSPFFCAQHAAAKNEFKADAPFLKLEAFGAALAAYAYKNIDAAVALLYALQAYSVNFGLAKGLMPNFFMALYQNDVIMEDAFQAWREDETNRTPGKEKTLQQTEKFFEYLQACVEERALYKPPHDASLSLPLFSFFYTPALFFPFLAPLLPAGPTTRRTTRRMSRR